MGDFNELLIDGAVADTVLLHLELDFGLTMADTALINMRVGSWDEYERLKAHALDALRSVVATMQRLETVDEAAIAQQVELAALVAAL